MPDINRIDHAILSGSEVERQNTWHGETLGMTAVTKTPSFAFPVAPIDKSDHYAAACQTLVELTSIEHKLKHIAVKTGGGLEALVRQGNGGPR